MAALKAFVHRLDAVGPPGFIHNAILAVAIMGFVFPLIYFLERHYGDGSKPYRTRNFLHDLVYCFYYRLNIHQLLIGTWVVAVLSPHLGFLRLNLLTHLPVAAAFALNYILLDFVQYWGHRWQHSSHFMWAFHSVHHTQQDVTFLTLTRVHPVERVIAQLYLLVPTLILGSPPSVFIGIFLFRQFLDSLEHARIDWTYGPFYRIFVSPTFHSRHHSVSEPDQHTNFGVSLSVWDFLFGTASAIQKRPTVCGVSGIAPGSIWSQLLLPLRILRNPALADGPIDRGEDTGRIRSVPALPVL